MCVWGLNNTSDYLSDEGRVFHWPLLLEPMLRLRYQIRINPAVISSTFEAVLLKVGGIYILTGKLLQKLILYCAARLSLIYFILNSEFRVGGISKHFDLQTLTQVVCFYFVLFPCTASFFVFSLFHVIQ